MIRKEYVIEVLGVESTHADIRNEAGNIVMDIVKIDEDENVEILSQGNTWKNLPVLTQDELNLLNGVVSE